LVAPTWFFYFALMMTATAICFTALMLKDNFVGLFETVLLFSILVNLLSYIAQKLSTSHDGRTVRDLVTSTTAKNYHAILPQYHNEEEMLIILKRTNVNTLGVKESEVTISARFQQDLGMN